MDQLAPQHVGGELSRGAMANLRRRTREQRPYPTAGSPPTAGDGAGADPLSEAEGVGGEAGAISGSLHADSEDAARELASRLSAVIFDRTHWQ